jgi:hypothetical protein
MPKIDAPIVLAARSAPSQGIGLKNADRRYMDLDDGGVHRIAATISRDRTPRSRRII